MLINTSMREVATCKRTSLPLLDRISSHWDSGCGPSLDRLGWAGLIPSHPQHNQKLHVQDHIMGDMYASSQLEILYTRAVSWVFTDQPKTVGFWADPWKCFRDFLWSSDHRNDWRMLKTKRSRVLYYAARNCWGMQYPNHITFSRPSVQLAVRISDWKRRYTATGWFSAFSIK